MLRPWGRSKEQSILDTGEGSLWNLWRVHQLQSWLSNNHILYTGLRWSWSAKTCSRSCKCTDAPGYEKRRDKLKCCDCYNNQWTIFVQYIAIFYSLYIQGMLGSKFSMGMSGWLWCLMRIKENIFAFIILWRGNENQNKLITTPIVINYISFYNHFSSTISVFSTKIIFVSNYSKKNQTENDIVHSKCWKWCPLCYYGTFWCKEKLWKKVFMRASNNACKVRRCSIW